MTKVDAELGRMVESFLRIQGVESSLASQAADPSRAAHAISEGVLGLLRGMGLDVEDDSIRDTPMRVARMYVDELFRGLNYNNFPKCTTFPNKQGYDQMVLVSHITTLSVCEHHLATIDGVTHIAYIPGQKVLGLSKFARITDFFARRPQVQERMTEQIFHALRYILDTDDVAVVQDCVHYCMKSRGAGEANSRTHTNRLGGRFLLKPELRAEFFQTVNARSIA